MPRKQSRVLKRVAVQTYGKISKLDVAISVKVRQSKTGATPTSDNDTVPCSPQAVKKPAPNAHSLKPFVKKVEKNREQLLKALSELKTSAGHIKASLISLNTLKEQLEDGNTLAAEAFTASFGIDTETVLLRSYDVAYEAEQLGKEAEQLDADLEETADNSGGEQSEGDGAEEE